MNPADLGNQRPHGWSKEGTAKRRDEFLRRCWGCKEENAVEPSDSLGLCGDCLHEFHHPRYVEPEAEAA